MQKPRAGEWDDMPIVPPPGTFTVEHEQRPVLYLPDGRVMVKRPIGYRTGNGKGLP